MPHKALVDSIGFNIIALPPQNPHTGVQAQISTTPREVVRSITVVILMGEGLRKSSLFGWKKLNGAPRIGRLYQHIPVCGEWNGAIDAYL
jgi:hypothetical protein